MDSPNESSSRHNSPRSPRISHKYLSSAESPRGNTVKSRSGPIRMMESFLKRQKGDHKRSHDSSISSDLDTVETTRSVDDPEKVTRENTPRDNIKTIIEKDVSRTRSYNEFILESDNGGRIRCKPSFSKIDSLRLVREMGYSARVIRFDREAKRQNPDLNIEDCISHDGPGSLYVIYSKLWRLQKLHVCEEPSEHTISYNELYPIYIITNTMHTLVEFEELYIIFINSVLEMASTSDLTQS